MEYAVTPTADPTPKRTRGAPRNTHPDKLKVNPDALARLNQWGDQLVSRLCGVKLTRSDLVNFLILNHAETLTADELRELEVKYFDEVKFGQWAVEELRAARARGELVGLADIIARYKPNSKPAKRVWKQKLEDSKPTEKPDKIAPKQPHPTLKASLISVEKNSEK